MFPLKNRKIIKPWGTAEGHIKRGLDIGGDYEAVYVNDYVPFNGRLETYTGVQGGKWCRLIRPNGDRIEMAHHSKFLLKNGQVKEGQAMAVTGNSGAITTGPHLHIQIFNKAGKRLDPEKYDWEEGDNVKLVNDKGTVFLVTGNRDKRKIGIADPKSLGLFGDEPQVPMDTNGIPEYQVIKNGQIFNK